MLFTGGDDYISGPYNVTFYSGDTSVEFDIPIKDNFMKETDESFTLKIDPSSLPSSVSVDNKHNTTVTIMDNDSK